MNDRGCGELVGGGGGEELLQIGERLDGRRRVCLATGFDTR